MKKTWVCVTILILSSSMVLAQPDTWIQKADMPTGRGMLAVSAVNGKIYAIGGWNGSTPIGSRTVFSAIEEYDPATDTWTRKTDMPTARGWLSSSVVKGKIYVIGGYNGGMLPIVEEYDPLTDTWTRKADMPTRRDDLGTAAVNGRIYAMGGLNSVVLSVVEEYDPATDTWTRKADMPAPKEWFGVGVVDGKIYVIGGLLDHPSGTPLSTVEAYDPVTDTWEQKADMPTPRDTLSVAVVDGKIYAIGGYQAPIIVEMYDPATDTWMQKANIPAPHWGLSVSEVNGRIYAIGGSGNQTIVVEYDTGTGIPWFQVKESAAQRGVTSGGDPVAIFGSNFPPGIMVTVGENPITQMSVSDSVITGIAPPGIEGRKNIWVTAPGLNYSVFAGEFIYNPSSNFEVENISPTNGRQAGGNPGTISGIGFLPGATVSIGENRASDVIVTPNLIEFIIPSGTEGARNVVVTNPDGQRGILWDGYFYNPLPVIERVEPRHGGPLAGGTTMTITGRNFMIGALVYIGESSAQKLDQYSPNEVRLETPIGSKGPKTVRLVNPDGQEAVIEEGFTYNFPPTIYNIQPNMGALEGGTLITITGSRFLSPVDVLIDGTEAKYTGPVNVSAEKIVAETPPSTAGVKDVTVINPDGQKDTEYDAFTYNPAPVITRVTPDNGRLAGGTSITVQGSGFLPGARVLMGIIEQTFTAALSVEVVSTNIITALTPPGEPGTKKLRVLNPDKQYVTLQEGFTYNPLPAIISITPNYGSASGGAKVIIQGTGFLQGARVMIGERSATAQWLDETAIEAVAPANPQGVWDVRVINPDTQEAVQREGFISVGELAYNYPNPFSASEGTTFRYVTDKPVESITVRIFNMAGVPIDVVQQTGSNEVEWHNTEAHGGLYIYLMEVQLEDGSKRQFRNTMEVYE